MIRRLLLAAAIAGAAIVLPAAPAQALYPCPAGKMCLHTWYTDSSRTQVRGTYSVNCEGTPHSWGVRQGYLVFTTQNCDGNPPVE
ncbi:hypothetical protein [Catelliglobosispora koreensis]|uniref:hypothetical protein n=1 Tax=Catelliglobosispora koreensis TaxID=129052 RepID=UPI00035E7C9E|nr:hypothetical protein [Catelliglobosispora koreensis]